MYIVHIFPAIGLWLGQRSTEIYLVSHHWMLFVPFGIIYSYINYCETL